MTREEAIKYLKQWNPINPAKKEAVWMAIDSLGQPQIVQCKDCKYRRSDNESCCFFGVTNPDFFCKCGVRKDGDGDAEN